MGVLDRFEKGVERVVSGAFAKAFRAEVKPVEIAGAVRREMDDRSTALSRDRVLAPNEFTVALSSSDHQRVVEWGEEVLAEEINAAAAEHAQDQGYHLSGPVDVSFTEGPDLETGRFRVRSASVRGAVAPAPRTASAGRRHPIVDIDGQRYLLTGAVTVIGRGSESDIVVDDTGVSRRHLEIRVTPDGVVATDLDSTNGTYVEGHRITAATLVHGNTITLGRTRVLYWDGDEAER